MWKDVKTMNSFFKMSTVATTNKLQAMADRLLSVHIEFHEHVRVSNEMYHHTTTSSLFRSCPSVVDRMRENRDMMAQLMGKMEQYRRHTIRLYELAGNIDCTLNKRKSMEGHEEEDGSYQDFQSYAKRPRYLQSVPPQMSVKDILTDYPFYTPLHCIQPVHSAITEELDSFLVHNS